MNNILLCVCCLLAAVGKADDGGLGEGVKATVTFTVDLDKISARANFANLFCCGDNFEDGFCVMVCKNGQLLVDIKGIEPSYYLTRTLIPSNRDCQLEVYVTPTCVRLFFGGKEVDSYPFVGTPDLGSTNRKIPHIGSFANYTLPGEVKSCTFESVSASTLPAGGPKPMIQELPLHQARAEIKWSKVICKEKDRYIGWPTCLRLKNGTILVAFSGDREAHVCPWGKVQLMRSTDDGETWEGPITVQNGPIDDRDCGLFQLPNGDVALTYFTSTAYRTKKLLETDWTPDQPQYWWKRHDEKLTDEVRRAATGYFRLVSKDNGQTWSKPMRMDLPATPHGPIVLRDGSLFQLSGGCVAAWRSDDQGATWRCLCPRLPDADEGKSDRGTYHEPNAIELPNGTLLGFIRCDDGDHHLRQTVSTDGGRTWSPMTATPMIGLPPHVIRLADGKLLCAYGRRVPQGGFGTFATLSDDEGQTWDVANEVCLRPCFKGDGDLAYPTSCQLPNGDIVTVFYQPEVKGEKPCLMATKWRVTK